MLARTCKCRRASRLRVTDSKMTALRKPPWLAAALALVVLATTAQAALMAVDLGGEFLKLSVVQPGRTPISIAINEMSRRKTPVLVGFLDGRRVLGEEAVTVSGRQPDKVFGRLRDMLGKPADDPAVAQLLQDGMLNYDVVKDSERGTVRLRVPGETHSEFSIEELMVRSLPVNTITVTVDQASALTYARQTVSEYTGSDVRSAVIIVPPYYGPSERRALLDSADMAGLAVLSLMNSHAAAALQYGIERDFSGRTENVVLYDVSSTDVVAALVEYSAYPVKGSPQQRSQFVVKDVQWREGAGASALDAILVRHFITQFEAQHGVSGLASMPKVVAKMAKPVRRTKEMLSANVDAPFSVEELFKGIDFASSVSRTEFERMAGPYWDQVRQPLDSLLERNGLGADSNFTVQLLGGGSRVPRVQAALATALPSGVRLERQLDADEAAAMGAGLYAANLSTSFRLRQFGMRDGNTIPVSITLDDLQGVPAHLEEYKAANGGVELYGAMRKLPSKRKLTLSGITADPFSFSLWRSHEGAGAGDAQRSREALVTYAVTGLKAFSERYGEAGKVSLHFDLDTNGLVNFVKGEARVDVTETIEVDAEVPDAEASGAAPASTLADGSASSSPNESQPSETDVEASDGVDAPEDGPDDDALTQDSTKSTSSPGGTAAEASAGPTPVKTKTVKVPKEVKRTRMTALEVANVTHHGVQPLGAEQKAASRALLAAFEAKEAAVRAAAKAQNELEAYIIKTRTAVEEDEAVAQVTTEEMRESFKTQLNDAEDWLYMDAEAEGADASVFQGKLAELAKVGDPIKTRVYEMARRPERMEKAKALAELVSKSVNVWPDTKPWLNETHVEDLKRKAVDFRAWLDEKDAAQLKRALYEEPAYLISELQDRFEVVSKMFSRLNSKPAPPPPKAPEVVADGNDTAAHENGTAEPASEAGDASADTTTPDGTGEEVDDKHEELRR